jgi:hypothetical protein
VSSGACHVRSTAPSVVVALVTATTSCGAVGSAAAFAVLPVEIGLLCPALSVTWMR